MWVVCHPDQDTLQPQGGFKMSMIKQKYCFHCSDDSVVVMLDGSPDGLPLCYNCYSERKDALGEEE